MRVLESEYVVGNSAVFKSVRLTKVTKDSVCKIAGKELKQVGFLFLM